MKKYSILINLLRNFFDKHNFIEIQTQNRLSVLVACHEPKLMCTLNYGGYVWPLPQSSIIWLEYELLNNTNIPGVYSLCTSYKNDPNYTRTMSENVFEADIVTPLFEIVTFGQYTDMHNIVVNLLRDLGFMEKYTFQDYNQLAKRRGSRALSISDITPQNSVTFLENVPKLKWGMESMSQVYINHSEILTFAHHTADPNSLIQNFLTLDDGNVADYLYSQFSKERVDEELYKFAGVRGKSTISCSINILNLMAAMTNIKLIG